MLALIKSRGFDSIPIPPPLNRLSLEEVQADHHYRSATNTPVQIPATFAVNWSNIVARFEKEFATTFSKSKKAHFDCLPREYKVVDGARVRWYPLLLLDAMIFILHNNYFRFATRRAFNQLEVLYDCILAEIEATQPDFYAALLGLEYQKQLSWPLENDGLIIYEDMSIEEQTSIASREEQKNLLISLHCAEKFPGIQVDQVDYPWHSVDELKNRVIEDPPSKSKQKFFTIIDYLSRHHSFQHVELSFPDLLKAMICKVLAYCGSNRALMVPTYVSSTHTTPSMARGESTSREEVPVVITPLHHSPATSMVRAGEDLSHSFEDCELPQSMTVIARSHPPKRKRSPKAIMTKRESLKIRRGSGSSHSSTGSHDHLVYSHYSPSGEITGGYSLPTSSFPMTMPTPTMTSTSREFTASHNSFLNPFSDEDSDLFLLPSGYPSLPKPQVRTVTMTASTSNTTEYNLGDYRERSNSTHDSISSLPPELSSVSWDNTTLQPALQLSSDSIFNISTDTMDLEEERNLREEKILFEENEEFSRRAESASFCAAAGTSPPLQPTKKLLAMETTMMDRETTTHTPTDEELIAEVDGSDRTPTLTEDPHSLHRPSAPNWMSPPPSMPLPPAFPTTATTTATMPAYSTQTEKLQMTAAAMYYPMTHSFYHEKASPRSVQSVLTAPKGWYSVHPMNPQFGIANMGPPSASQYPTAYFMTPGNPAMPSSPTHFTVPQYTRPQYYFAVVGTGRPGAYYGSYPSGNYVHSAASPAMTSPQQVHTPTMMSAVSMYDSNNSDGYHHHTSTPHGSDSSHAPDPTYLQ